MHDPVRQFVERHATRDRVVVVEFGSRNVNGTVRDLWSSADYTGVDLLPGSLVDVVADAATYEHDQPADVVVCCEVLEHARDWPSIVHAIGVNLRHGGLAIVTCAGPERGPHAASGGPQMEPGEHYGNVDPGDLCRELFEWASHVDVTCTGADIHATATKGRTWPTT